jgi:hypothetical protein
VVIEEDAVMEATVRGLVSNDEELQVVDRGAKLGFLILSFFDLWREQFPKETDFPPIEQTKGVSDSSASCAL